MKNLGLTAALVAGLTVAAGANASLIAVQADADTKAFTIQSNNDYKALVGTEGQIGASLVATTAAPIQLTFEYLFKEASYTNTFVYISGQQFSTKTSKAGDSFSVLYTGGAGALDFSFLSKNHAGKVTTVTNAGNDGNALANFWIGAAGTNSFILALDDGGNTPKKPDDNHDDLIVKVTATAVSVPEPASIALLGLGVLGLGLARRRG